MEAPRLCKIWLLHLLGLDAYGSRHPYCDILRSRRLLCLWSVANSDNGAYTGSVYLVQSPVLGSCLLPEPGDKTFGTGHNMSIDGISACFRDSLRPCNITINSNEHYGLLLYSSCTIVGAEILRTPKARDSVMSATGYKSEQRWGP